MPEGTPWSRGYFWVLGDSASIVGRISLTDVVRGAFQNGNLGCRVAEDHGISTRCCWFLAGTYSISVDIASRGEWLMPGPWGFEYDVRDGEVVITHHGRPATTLRGASASRFLVDVESDDAQLLMACLTGQYKRGNEKVARRHPRNQSR